MASATWASKYCPQRAISASVRLRVRCCWGGFVTLRSVARAVAKSASFSSFVISTTVPGRIVIRQRQLAAGGLLGEPAQLDYARQDQNVLRGSSHGVPIRLARWCDHSTRLQHGPRRALF